MDILDTFIPAALILLGLVIVLLSIYAQRMRNRYESMVNHEKLFVGQCPHVNSTGSPIRRQGMAINVETGEISAHSQISESLVKAIS